MTSSSLSARDGPLLIFLLAFTSVPESGVTVGASAINAGKVGGEFHACLL